MWSATDLLSRFFPASRRGRSGLPSGSPRAEGEGSANLIPAVHHPGRRLLDRPLFVLVGGATGVGKSTVAEALARQLGILRVVTTDVVREVMRAAVPEPSPSLCVSSFEAGDVASSSGDPAGGRGDVIEGFLEQAGTVAIGIRALMRRARVEATDMIVEGVHLVPGIVELPDEREAVAVPIVIVLDDVDAHRSYLVERARGTPGRPSDRYLNRLDDIRRIQAAVVRRAEDHGVATVRAASLDETVSAALEIVEKALVGVI